jgi:hypothetical protein
MATQKQRKAARKNIKKAQRVWDSMHYSRAEGKIQSRITSGGKYFYYNSKHTTQSDAIRKANNIRKQGYLTRIKYLTVGGKNIYIVYKGPRRKKRVTVFAGKGPKGQRHKKYTKSAPKWKGYGKREKPGLGKKR